MTCTALLFSKVPGCPEAKSRLRKSNRQDISIDALHLNFVKNAVSLLSGCSADFKAAAWHPNRSSIPEELRNNWSFLEHFDQIHGGFSEKLHAAVQLIFTKLRSGVVVIGSDCPFLTHSILEKALSEVRQNKLVIGPSLRGGMYLMGIPFELSSIDLRDCFVQGEERSVFASKAKGCHVTHLPFLPDIDYMEDLEKWGKYLINRGV